MRYILAPMLIGAASAFLFKRQDAPPLLTNITFSEETSINRTIVQKWTDAQNSSETCKQTDEYRDNRGHGPLIEPDTYEIFRDSAEIRSLARKAPIPQDYLENFMGENACVNANGFLAAYNMSKYDTVECARRCDAFKNCGGFNIFVERRPQRYPGPQCPNPHSFSLIKCTVWELDVDIEHANNKGYTDTQFKIGIAGSNGYMKARAYRDLPPKRGEAALSVKRCGSVSFLLLGTVATLLANF